MDLLAVAFVGTPLASFSGRAVLLAFLIGALAGVIGGFLLLMRDVEVRP